MYMHIFMTIYEKKTHSYSLEYYPPENKSSVYYYYAYVQMLLIFWENKDSGVFQPPSCSQATRTGKRKLFENKIG